MGVSPRDLNDWADALNANNDEDAKLAVVDLMKKAMFASEAAQVLARHLSELPGVGDQARTARARLEDALGSLTYVAVGFDRHERGMH